jgi:hypothetical protein
MNNEWYTPEDELARVRVVMPVIDLDPATCLRAQRSVRARAYYSLSEDGNDGLKLPWAGRIWLNPPYSAPLCGLFYSRLIHFWSRGDVVEALSVSNNATDTGWWHAMAARCSAICFTRGRVGFVDQNGQPVKNNMKGQCFWYFGHNARLFEEVYRERGTIYIS